jgi:hypothetical protein
VIHPSTVANEMSSSKNGEMDNLGVFGYVMEEGYSGRVNTVQSYHDANRDVARGATKYLPLERVGKNNYIHESAVVDPKTQACNFDVDINCYEGGT